MTQPIFVGPDPLPALASGLPVLCGDDLGIRGTERAGVTVLGSRDHSTAALLEDPRSPSHVRDRRLVLWKTSTRAERAAQRSRASVASSPAATGRRLENKAYFSSKAAQAGLPTPPTVFGPAGPDLLAEAVALRGPWVVQLAHGYSGRQTFAAGEPEDLELLLERHRGRLCRVSTRVDGVAVTITGVVGKDRVVVGNPCLQLTGIPALTPHPLGSCGNDFFSGVPAAEEVIRLARRAGEWAGAEGHRGVFGLDLVVGGAGDCWCIEVNPRLVASVPLLSISSRGRGEPGILQLHLAAFEGDLPEIRPVCDWSQVIAYRLADEPEPPPPYPAGRLRRGRGDLLEVGGLDLDGPQEDEVAVIRRRGEHRGTELGRLLFRGPCLDERGGLRPWIGRALERMRNAEASPK